MGAAATDQGLELLVASGGGHLHELMLLRQRLEPALPRAHWVTYGTAEAQARLVGEQVTTCHFPTTRSLPNAARNLVLARRLLRELRPARVVSTGAGVAVPFLFAAQRLGIPAYYLESAARVDAPSLTGRMLQPLSGVRRFTQYAGWTDPRWEQGASVFDGYHVRPPSSAPVDRPLRIALSLGTHHFRFDRLVRALAAVTDERDEVFAQVGPSNVAPAHWTVAERVKPDDLAARLRWADVVVCHAGVGLILTTLDVGKAPLVVPRLERHAEHVDDHQVEIAAALRARGMLATGDATGILTREALLDQAGRVVEAAGGEAPGISLGLVSSPPV